jgi:hypothetical protein
MTSENKIPVMQRIVAGDTYWYQVWDTMACHKYHLTVHQWINTFLTVPMPTIILTISKSHFSPSNLLWKQQYDITHASNLINEAVHIHRTKSTFSSTFCVLITSTTHWNSKIRKDYHTHQLLELFQVIVYFCYWHMIPGPYRIGLKVLTLFWSCKGITSPVLMYFMRFPLVCSWNKFRYISICKHDSLFMSPYYMTISPSSRYDTCGPHQQYWNLCIYYVCHKSLNHCHQF